VSTFREHGGEQSYTRTSELGPYTNMLAWHNPDGTDHANAAHRTDAIGNAFIIPSDNRHVILDFPTPGHVQEHVNGATIIDSDGGDGSKKRHIESGIGVVTDDPEASANNFKLHRELARDILYVPVAGGNANNFALSALGRYAHEPELLEQAAVRVGLHRPLLYRVVNERGDTIRYGCAPTCIGIGGAALVATALDEQKPALKQLSERPFGSTRRTVREFTTAASTLLRADPFSAEVTLNVNGKALREDFDALTGIEVVGSRIYAKEGRTNANIDDSNYQVVISKHHAFGPARLAGLAALTARLKTGIHPVHRMLDFSNLNMAIKPTGDDPVPFHVEGEIGDAFQLDPGQTLHLRLAQIAVPVLMRK
jgi:hypothetical protein